MDKKPVSEKKNIFGRTVRRTFSKTTNRDYEGMPYGRETVKKTKAVFDKEGNFVKGKKVSYQETSGGSRVLGSRKVERFSPDKDRKNLFGRTVTINRQLSDDGRTMAKTRTVKSKQGGVIKTKTSYKDRK
jgi:hypothetical protein